MGYYDWSWSKQDVMRGIDNAIKEGRTSVGLSMEKNTHQNELDVIRWAKELGHEATLEFETVTVKINKVE